MMDECAHCEREILRSCVLEESDQEIRLKCTACDGEYSVPNTPKQRAVMTHEYGRPFATESVFKITQLGVGDIFEYETSGRLNFTVKHDAVCLEVLRHSEEVVVSEVLTSNFTRSHCNTKLSMTDLQKCKATLYRFMPLDCLPLNETIQRATNYEIGSPSPCPFSSFSASNESPKFFGSWCKTGMNVNLNQNQVSVLKAMGTVVWHPMRSMREWNNIGAGWNPPDDKKKGSGEGAVGWSSNTKGWSGAMIQSQGSKELVTPEANDKLKESCASDKAPNKTVAKAVDPAGNSKTGEEWSRDSEASPVVD